MTPSPYTLVILAYDEDRSVISRTEIDPDEPGWKKVHAGAINGPGRWLLVERGRSRPSLMMDRDEDDQVMYVARHIHALGRPDRVTCYGLARYRFGMPVESMWVMPNGAVVCNDDVYRIGTDLLEGRA